MRTQSPNTLLTTIRTQLASGELVLEGVTDTESFLKGVEYTLELQREINSQNSKEAIRKAKDAGIYIGRPRGAKSIHEHTKLYPYEDIIREMLAQGATYGEIAARVCADRHTVKSHIDKFLKTESETPPKNGSK